MSWKRFLVVGFAIIGIISGYAQYYLYQIEHKYDHLPRVLLAPPATQNDSPQLAYQGAHPSQSARPVDLTPALIKLGEVGPAAPLFAGPKQYPFLCNTEESGLGQPLVDNNDGYGIPVYFEQNGEKTEIIIGYSQDCQIPTRAWYYYLSSKDQTFYPLKQANGDITQIELAGKQIPFIVRVEMGTINRFIYTIAALKGANGRLDAPDGKNWNRKLIYQFRGGIGIGRVQGKNEPTSLISRRVEELMQGYAVIYSTGNQTSNHYNIWLAEDTALRVKRQFNQLYGEQEYVVGLGGSGGAVQQYLIGQNNPGFLDAAIALYSYPDMITQTTYVFDCELMEYYFDITDNDNNKWQDWQYRQAIEGMNAKAGISNEYSTLYDLNLKIRGKTPPSPAGMSECTKSWRGVTPLVNNPKFYHHFQRFSKPLVAQTHWSHWEDLKAFYGVDHHGYAQQTFDNVGVQYGLNALQNKQISIEEFLDLNAKIGGWKQPEELSQEKFWKISGQSIFSEFSSWSSHNMTVDKSGDAKISPRTKGSIQAMNGAYLSGNVFLGHLDIPVIDLRHYLDDELDMHHAAASFATRLRMLNAQGHADNQLIWMTKKPHNPLPQALAVIDSWLSNLKKVKAHTPQQAMALSRPDEALDRCYSAQGEIVAEGNHVWDGQWNKQTDGDCMRLYPIYSDPRTVAGASLAGDTFKCALQSVNSAIAQGVYQDNDMQPYLSRLKTVFPDGVCDYSQPDLGRPDDRTLAFGSNKAARQDKQTLELRVGQ